MSLATRCPACSTVFRVVQDQLRVSEGWVRCGQCQEVFNALETLFDLGVSGTAETPAGPSPTTPPQPSPLPATPVPATPVPAAPTAAWPPAPAFEATHQPEDHAEALAVEQALGELTGGPHPKDHWDPDQSTLPMSLEALAANYRAGQPTPSDAVPAVASHTLPSAPSPPAPPPVRPDEPGIDIRMPRATSAPVEADAEQDEDDEAPTPSRFIGPAPDWARTPASERRSKKKSRRGTGTEAALAQAHVSEKAQRRRRKPEFVRQAERAALWRRPLVRALLGGASALLVAALLGQVAYQYRDPLAARSPMLAPALQAGCDWLGCRIAAPRALERIRLDASDLTRTDEAQVLRFTADLHNTADHAVRMPALDLSFTDSLGQVVSRKVLLPAELGARGDAMAAEGQWRVDARLAVGELRIAGYTVEVFYP